MKSKAQEEQQQPVSLLEIVVEQEPEGCDFSAPQSSNEDDVTGQLCTLGSKSIEDLTTYDLNTIRRLQNEYRRALEENQIATLAKFASIREAAGVVVTLFFTVLSLGTWHVKSKSGCTIAQAILYTSYTITSAGFGSVVIPKTDAFLFFAIAYVFAGITLVALLAAQVFQYLEAAAIRYSHMTDKSENAANGLQCLKDLLEADKDADLHDVQVRMGLIRTLQSFQKNLSKFDRQYNLRSCLSKFRKYSCLASLLVPIYLISLLAIGAVTMYYVEEGWTPVQSLYFASFAMSTVGYGDMAPVTQQGTWFVAFWLPFNVSFLALFLGSVAHYYVKFSNWNVRRIEAEIRKERKETNSSSGKQKNRKGGGGRGSIKIVTMQSARSRHDIEGSHMLGGLNVTAGHESLASLSKIDSTYKSPSGRDEEQGKLAEEEEQVYEFNLESLFALQDQPIISEGDKAEETDPVTASSRLQRQKSVRLSPRRRRKKELSLSVLTFGEGDAVEDAVQVSLDTTKDLLVFLGVAGHSKTTNNNNSKSGEKNEQVHHPDTNDLALMLRFRVLERVAKIVAFENTHHDEYEIQGNDLIITIEKLREILPKWLIPHRARNPFRDVYCNSILFVGNRAVARKGADAFFALNPFDFSDLFSPFVAAFGDFEMMEEWLASTEVLASTYLVFQSNHENNNGTLLSASTANKNEEFDEFHRNKRAKKNTIEAYFPCNPGNAVMMHFTATNN